jgi:YesN/AraC family two-component response regulator
MTTTIPQSQAPTILVIDDEIANLSLMVDTLNKFGFEIMIAHNGLDGITKAQQELPHLILLDVKMPVWNGFETCIHLKANPVTRNIPVIFLTVLNESSEKIKGFQVGGIDYLTKPIHEQEMLARVTTHLKIRLPFQQVAEPLAVYQSTSSMPHTIDSSITTVRPPFISQAQDLLLANLHEPLSLKKLATSVGTNPTKLSKAFQQHFGMTVFDYLREQRLIKARVLLRQSIFSIQQIADTVGYKNPSDFTVAFKQRFGLTPRQYRRNETNQSS